MAELTRFERVEIQMEMLVPIIRRLQEQLGVEPVLQALRQQLDDRVEAAAAARTAKGRSADMTRVAPEMAKFAAGGALEFTVVREDDTRVDLDVGQCQYAALMDRLDARDLGEILLCGDDYVGAAAVGMDLERAHTHMKGDSVCDFRFRKVDQA